MAIREFSSSKLREAYDTKLGRKRVSSRKPKRLPPSQRIQTDDLVDLIKGIALSIGAAYVSITAIKKVGNALSNQSLAHNVEDIKKDALDQLRKSLKVINIAVKRSKTTFHGKSRKQYGPYGKFKVNYSQGDEGDEG